MCEVVVRIPSGAGRTVGALVLMLCCLVQCAPAAPANAVPLAARTASGAIAITPLPPARHERGLVFVTLAGARADLTAKFISDNTMPTLARIGANGARADALQPLDPTTAASAQMSLLTGASATRTGIVADNFRKVGQAIGQSVNGFEFASSVEPIYRSAMRAGMTAALVGYPASLLNASGLRADWMATTGTMLAPAAQHVLKFADAKGWSNLPSSFSAPKEAKSAIVQSAGTPPLDLFVLALDTSDDKQENYDTWLLSRTRAIDSSTLRLRLNEWGTFVVDSLLQSSVAFKVTDASPAHFAIYQSALILNQIAPPELARTITQQFGTTPAPADGDALERNWIDEGTYLQMGERALAWQWAVSGFIHRQLKPDVLLMRVSVIEEAQRELLLTEPRQWRYTPERAQSDAGAVRRAYELVDTGLGQLLIQLDLNTSALVVASDRGMMPVHTQVNLNRWLNERKWLTFQKDGVDVSKSKAFALTSDGVAHIYINLKGREPSGIVEQAEYNKLQSDLVSGLKELTDPIDNQPIIARVLRRQDLAALNLQHDNSGDVFVQAWPGFVFSAARERNTNVEPATFHAASGYDASLPEMRGIFFAYGAGIGTGSRLSSVRALDLAPTLNTLLRLTPATFVEGKVIEGVLKMQ